MGTNTRVVSSSVGEPPLRCARPMACTRDTRRGLACKPGNKLHQHPRTCLYKMHTKRVVIRFVQIRLSPSCDPCGCLRDSIGKNRTTEIFGMFFCRTRLFAHETRRVRSSNSIILSNLTTSTKNQQAARILPRQRHHRPRHAVWALKRKKRCVFLRFARRVLIGPGLVLGGKLRNNVSKVCTKGWARSVDSPSMM